MLGQPFTPRTVAARRRASVFQAGADTHAARVYPNGFNVLEKKRTSGEGVQCALRAIYDSFAAQCPERRGEMSLRDLGLAFDESSRAQHRDARRTYHFIEKLGRTLRVWGENRASPLDVRLGCVLIDGREWVDSEADGGGSGDGVLPDGVKILFITTVNSNGALTYNVSDDFRGLMPSRRSLSGGPPRGSPTVEMSKENRSVMLDGGDDVSGAEDKLWTGKEEPIDPNENRVSEELATEQKTITEEKSAFREQARTSVDEMEALVSQILNM